MKNWAMGCAVAAILAGMVGSVSANEIPPSTLASMGLGGVHQMSDNDGLAVRGLGGPIAYGLSYSIYSSSHSVNGYVAQGHTFAAGNNLSFAGAVSNCSFVIAAAGGSSAAHK